jgi:hypothetical protein
MKAFKIGLCIVLVGLVSVVVVGNVKAKSNIIEETTEVNTNILEQGTGTIQLDNVFLENTLSEESVEVATENQYKVEKDGVTYNFLFPIPAESDLVIEQINKFYEEEFTECNISYISDDAIEGQYNVQIGTESFIINVTL